MNSTDLKILLESFDKINNNITFLGDAVFQLVCVESLFNQIGRGFQIIQKDMEYICSRSFLSKTIDNQMGDIIKSQHIEKCVDSNLSEIKKFKLLLGIYYNTYGYERTKNYITDLLQLEKNKTIKIVLKKEKAHEKVVQGIETSLGYKFKSKENLNLALIGTDKNTAYQYLCLLGDRVINLLICERIHDLPLDTDSISVIKSKVESNQTFAFIFDYSGINKWILKSNDNSYRKWKSDYIEALFGSVFLDSGLEDCKNVFEKLILIQLDKKVQEETKKYKGLFDNK